MGCAEDFSVFVKAEALVDEENKPIPTTDIVSNRHTGGRNKDQEGFVQWWAGR
jgi:hypothetical protein